MIPYRTTKAVQKPTLQLRNHARFALGAHGDVVAFLNAGLNKSVNPQLGKVTTWHAAFRFSKYAAVPFVASFPAPFKRLNI